ncbi:hypothetical protein [Ferdinandcohnia sp. SAFN-114]|uniref:hypothetical protein n=1 Tax=Ferdinandcohnia sp. SAFN-114 TaxID=3387275 RepID=UPI003F80A778
MKYQNIDVKEILAEALFIMTPKIKKSLLNTHKNERDDLEQEIKLKVVEAVYLEKIETPPTFKDFYKNFNKNRTAS